MKITRGKTMNTGHEIEVLLKRFLLIVFVIAITLFARSLYALECRLPSDTQVRTVPSVSRPGYLQTTVDPTFGAKITRITDDPGRPVGSISGAVWGSVARHHYSKDQPWNADGSLFYIDRNTGGSPSSSLFLDGNTYQPLFTGKSKPSGAEIRWHASKPDVMQYVGTNVVGEWNVRTGVKSIIRTFTGYSGFKLGPSEGNFSYDSKMVAIAALDPSGNEVIFAYDISANIKYPDISLAFTNDLDWVSISPKGTYVVLQHDEDATIVYDLNGKKISEWKEYGTPSHYDLSVDADGNEIGVGVAKSGQSGRVIKRRLKDGAITALTTGGYASHTSTRSFAAPGLAFSTYNDNPSHPPYISEIVMIRLDGTGVYRIAHHHSNVTDYLAEVHAVPSRDGTRIAFASNWEASSGRPVQTYIADIRHLCSVSPSPTPTPEPTPVPTPIATPTPPPASHVLQIPISYSTDDAEEQSNGSVNTTSTDIELVHDGSDQIVGLRFVNVGLPKGTVISKAYLQFAVDEVTTSRADVTIYAQNDAAPATFTTISKNISARPLISSSVPWNAIPPWNTVGAQDLATRSPNLQVLVQALVNQSSWTTGGSMVFIIKGSGKRTATSYDGTRTKPTVLVIEY